MKSMFMQVMQSVAMGAVIPGLLFSAVKNGAVYAPEKEPDHQIQTAPPMEQETENTPEPVKVTVPVLKSDGLCPWSIKIFIAIIFSL